MIRGRIIKMANMAHVRFENTYRDLKDIYEHLEDDDLSDDEIAARENLIALCVRIAEDFGCYTTDYDYEDYDPTDEFESRFDEIDTL